MPRERWFVRPRSRSSPSSSVGTERREHFPQATLALRQRGIASIVVLPLLTRSGEVRGVFELFSDHAYAFEERDLIALERMADLTMTALDLAERRPHAVPAPAPVPEPTLPVAAPAESEMNAKPAEVTPPDTADTASPQAEEPAIIPPERPLGGAQVHSAP